MKPETLLGDLFADGYRVEVEGGRLFLSHPRRKPSLAVMSEVSRLKTQLIALIEAPNESGAPLRVEAAQEPRTGKADSPPVRDPLAALAAAQDRMTGGEACRCRSCSDADEAAAAARRGDVIDWRKIPY